MERAIARKTWRTLEPLHAIVYFAREADEAYTALGLSGDGHRVRPGYFASRAAPMGPVPAEVVIATFFNFHPDLVRAAVPWAWEVTSPAAVLDARHRAAGAVLWRLLGEEACTSDALAEAAGLARQAAERAAGRPEGRPLFAGHAALPWPDEPHLVLWHAQTLLREFRGDAHVAALTAEGVTGCEALLLHAATGEVPAAVLRASRAWPDEDWQAAAERLRARGWLDAGGSLTPAGRDHRQWVEDRTDELSVPAYEVLGEDRCEQLRALCRPWSRRIVESGELTFG